LEKTSIHYNLHKILKEVSWLSARMGGVDTIDVYRFSQEIRNVLQKLLMLLLPTDM